MSMMTGTRNLTNQKGQGVVEAVLLLALLVSISMLVTKELQDRKFAQKLFGEPWNRLSGMVECGVWSGCAKADKHPASERRRLTYKPEE